MTNMINTDPGPAMQPPQTMLGVMQDAAKAKPEISPERAALVKELLDKVKGAKKHFEKPFKRMREDMLFAANRNGEQWGGNEEKYVANITQRHIQQKVATLYAKNPQVRVQRKPRMDFQIWDGKKESLQAAFQSAMQAMQPLMGMAVVGPGGPMQAAMPGPQELMGAMAGNMLPPQVTQLLSDVQQGLEKKQQLEKIGRTGELLFKYFMNETEPKVKPQLKQSVRRSLTAGVSYLRLDFQRLTERDPTMVTRITRRASKNCA